jgi:hypothetical protein
MSDPTDYADWVKKDMGKAREAFDRAHSTETQKPTETQQQGIGSEQVAKSAPQMQPKPPSMTRDAVDRQAHAERTAQDRAKAEERAKQLSDAVKERSQNDKSKEKDQER